MRYDLGDVSQLSTLHPMPHYLYGAYLIGGRGRGVFQIDFGRDGSAVAVTAQRSTTLGSLDRECI